MVLRMWGQKGSVCLDPDIPLHVVDNLDALSDTEQLRNAWQEPEYENDICDPSTMHSIAITFLYVTQEQNVNRIQSMV